MCAVCSELLGRLPLFGLYCTPKLILGLCRWCFEPYLARPNSDLPNPGCLHHLAVAGAHTTAKMHRSQHNCLLLSLLSVSQPWITLTRAHERQRKCNVGCVLLGWLVKYKVVHTNGLCCVFAIRTKMAQAKAPIAMAKLLI